MSYYRQQLENWLSRINVKAERVADIGGASNPVRKRVKSWDVHDCAFFDNGAEEAKVDFMHFDINIPLTDQFKGYREIDLKKDFRFDTIFCLEVFEYVWNPVQAIKNIYDLLTPDGIAYISFPSIYPVHNPINIDYLRYTRNVIEKYLNDVGFDRFEITPRIATEGLPHLSKFYQAEGMHPVKNSDRPYDIGYLVKAYRVK